MNILQLAALGWGLLFATFIGLYLHGSRKWRAARDFNSHVVGVLEILREPRCRNCWATYRGDLADHDCGDRA